MVVLLLHLVNGINVVNTMLITFINNEYLHLKFPSTASVFFNSVLCAQLYNIRNSIFLTFLSKLSVFQLFYQPGSILSALFMGQGALLSNLLIGFVRFVSKVGFLIEMNLFVSAGKL